MFQMRSAKFRMRNEQAECRIARCIELLRAVDEVDMFSGNKHTRIHHDSISSSRKSFSLPT